MSTSVAVVVSTCLVSAAAAQSVAAPDLKAAFLFNFAKFAEWPSEVLPAGAPLLICVVGERLVADALVETIKGHAIEGHALEVRYGRADVPLRSCHVLYWSSTDSKLSIQLLDSLKDAPVFTVGEFDRFAPLGGVAHFFVENGRMRFAFNVEAAQRAHLRISSKVLGLAKIVKDERYAQP